MRENLTSGSTAEPAPDPRSPLVFDARDVGRRAGSKKDYRRSVPAPAGLGQEMIGVPEGAPLELDLTLQSVTEGVLVTGSVTGEVVGECGRCLEPVREPLHVEVCELFAYPDSTTDETSEQDEVRRIVIDLIDVEPVVRDTVVPGLPWTPLCRPECAGLCPNCGQRLDDLPAGHSHEQIDPRWAALSKFAGPAGTPADSPGGDDERAGSAPTDK